MPWTCPNCDRELKSKTQPHVCVKVSLDDLFKGKPAELLLIFDKILAEVADWPDVLISATPHCIVFVHKQTFFIIRPMQKHLELKFYSAEAINNVPQLNSMALPKRYQHKLRLGSLAELTPQVFMWLRGSYELL